MPIPMPDDDVLKIRIENHICLLTLNRPEARNALSAELSLALVEAILDADENPDVWRKRWIPPMPEP